MGGFGENQLQLQSATEGLKKTAICHELNMIGLETMDKKVNSKTIKCKKIIKKTRIVKKVTDSYRYRFIKK